VPPRGLRQPVRPGPGGSPAPRGTGPPGDEPPPVPRAAAPARTKTPDDPSLPRRVTRDSATGHRASGARSGRRGTARTLGRALLATAASAVVPGSGHLLLQRRRTGALILGVFGLAVAAFLILGLGLRRSDLVSNLLSTRVLIVVTVGCVVAALAWIAVVLRTYLIARPHRLTAGSQTIGLAVVSVLCLGIAAPFGFAANLANSQRGLLDTLFTGGGGTSVAEAISKPRLNVLLMGSDAGADRTGARSDTMMVASIDTHTGRTTIFGLPRNIGYAQFPPGTPMAGLFPKGFHDPNGDPLSGEYILNAVYAYGLTHPAVAPRTPSTDPGLNLLHQTVSYMLGIPLDYYIEVDMAGFASIIDALGGVTVNVGPVPLPIGGVLPDGTHVTPDGYIPAGVQHLDGDKALWFARSRRDADDYARMARQRCLLQDLLAQNSPTDVLAHFQAIATATTNTVTTNIPQEVLPSLASLAGRESVQLDSISFDPNLPDPSQPDGKFDPARANVALMRQVVQNAITKKKKKRRKRQNAITNPPPTLPPISSAPTSHPTPPTQPRTTAGEPTAAASPTSLANSCA
jgi:polyisoprenyl-teichoic acid--peptidoglycan teichoic acid transferase